MEHSASILLPGGQIENSESLQNSLYSKPHLLHSPNLQTKIKLAEAESRLTQVFEEYSGRIESLIALLDSLNEAVFIINTGGETTYSNEAANLLEAFMTQSGLLTYKNLPAEETLTVNFDGKHNLQIRMSNFIWNGEASNLFILSKHEIPVAPVVTVVEQSITQPEPFSALLHAVKLIADNENSGNKTEALACATMVAGAIGQSEKLLADVKTFSALSGYEPAFTALNMQKLVGDVLKSMGPEIEEAEIEVTVSDLPETRGDKELVLKLLKQLVSNAIKFRNKSKKAVIDIGHDKSEGQYIFCVRDNGIGISKKYHDEVFKIFTMLNDVNQYPGNGLGLAISKKITDLHDGKIWVESLPGHGSNFYFRLNAK